MIITRWTFALTIVSTLILSACSSDQPAGVYRQGGKGVAAVLKARFQPDKSGLAAIKPADAAALRTVLQQDGQPIYLVEVRHLAYLDLMATYGQNGDVTTWASPAYQSIAVRQGVVLATRGFGDDLMSSTGPSVAQIAIGQGATQRQYFYIDGADQGVQRSFTCKLTSAGPQSTVILSRTYATRKVVETCSGPSGAFQNEFWFDNGTNLRQSRQMFALGLEKVLMQRVID